MLFLSLDTSTPAVTCGLVDWDPAPDTPADPHPEPREVVSRVTVDARAHAELLVPHAREVCVEAGVALADIDAVVVGCGPGPFTGLRVGMATAEAIGYAAGVPVVGVGSLDALYAAIPRGERPAGDLLVVTDARRREVYYAWYRGGSRRGEPGVGAPADLSLAGAEALAGDPGCREAVRAARGAEGESVRIIDVVAPTPTSLVGAAREELRTVLYHGAMAAPRVPLYLRRPDATMPRPRRVSAALTGLEAVEDHPAPVLGPLRESDAERCAELEAQLFAGDDPWTAAAFREELARPWTHYVAARVGDELVGYAGSATLGPADDPEHEIHTIGVDPRYRRRGLGRALLAAILEGCDGPVHLEVRADNEPAQTLYRSEGFAEVGVRRGYYQPSGADAVTMVRPARTAPGEE